MRTLYFVIFVSVSALTGAWDPTMFTRFRLANRALPRGQRRKDDVKAINVD